MSSAPVADSWSLHSALQRSPAQPQLFGVPTNLGSFNPSPFKVFDDDSSAYGSVPSASPLAKWGSPETTENGPDDFYGDDTDGDTIKSFGLGALYIGQVVDGLRHGSGSMEYADGSAYTGEWCADMASGKGNKTFADGSMYKGEFARGKRDGAGAFTSPAGIYDGEWKVDAKWGAGCLLDKDGHRLTGRWNRDRMVEDAQWTIAFSNGNTW